MVSIFGPSNHVVNVGNTSVELVAGAKYGVAAIDPTTLGTLGLWVKADTGLWQNTAGTTPVTSAADPVQRWDDQSGNGRNATNSTAGSIPTYQVSGAIKMVRFDGNDRLATAYSLNNEPMTLGIVVRPTSTTAGGMLVASEDTTPYKRIWAGFEELTPGAAGKFGVWKGQGTTYDGAWESTGQSNNVFYVVVIRIATGGGVTVYLNGASDGGATAVKTSTWTVNVGGGLASSYRPLNGDIVEALVYSTDIGATNCGTLSTYLNRWAIY